MRKQLDKDNNLTRAAMKAGLDRKTARRYRDQGMLPSEERVERTWRTRDDAFADDWPDVEAKLVDAPGLDAKTLFDDLCARKPDKYEPRQLRTLQRRVKQWRASRGPEKEIRFAQEHRPGEAMQTDFTVADELGITIRGEPLAHMFCVSVLPYSNWRWATLCQSESMAALKVGVHAALRELGGVAEFHQTDSSTAATHRIGQAGTEHPTGHGRAFNDEYVRWMKQLGMKPRTTGIGQKEQNGDVEAANGVLKRMIEQHLLLRGSRDFESSGEYEAFVHGLVRKANAKLTRVADERPLLQPLPTLWFPEYTEIDVWVTPWSTIRVKHNTYSVPSRLMGEQVRARVYDDRIEVWFATKYDLTIPRLHGRNGHSIDYRHMVWSLVKKPGAFARYRYREDLFPSLAFRKAYDSLRKRHVERIADIEYVRILHLAASTMEADVTSALELALEAGEPFDAEVIRGLVKPRHAARPMVAIPVPDLTSYDALLPAVAK